MEHSNFPRLCATVLRDLGTVRCAWANCWEGRLLLLLPVCLKGFEL